MQQQSVNKRKRSIHRNVPRLILYFLLFLAILIACYFALENHLEGRHIFSIFLGILVCLVIQFRLLGTWGAKEIEEDNCDEIDVVKMKIKGFFGQLNIKNVQYKNQKKYYFYSSNYEYMLDNPNDKLFNQQNHQLFDSVMAHLRENNNIQYYDIILQISIRWNTLEQKLIQLQRLLTNVSKGYQFRVSIYKKYNSLFNKFQEIDYSKWQILFNRKLQQLRQNKDIEQQNNILFNVRYKLTWKTLTYFLEERSKHNQNRLKQIVDTILNQFKIFSKQILIRKQTNIKQLEKLCGLYSNKKRSQMDIQSKIIRIKQKIQQLQKSIQKLKIKSIENIEQILKYQVQLRLLRVELQNQQIKKSSAKDSKQKCAQQLHNDCQRQNQYLNGYGIKLFNNKLINYINILLDHQEKYYQKLYKHIIQITNSQEMLNRNQPLMKLQRGQDQQLMLSIYNTYQQIQQSFKQYLDILKGFYQEYLASTRQISKIISGYGQKQKILRPSKISYQDWKFIKLCDNLAQKQSKVAELSQMLITKQLETFQQHQKHSKILKGNIKGLTDKIQKTRQKNKKELNNKQKLQQPDYQLLLSLAYNTKQLNIQLYQYIKQYINSSIQSNLYDLVNCIFLPQQNLQNNLGTLRERAQEEPQDDPRLVKFRQYSDYCIKISEKNWSEGKVQHLVNRLLSVFFRQWSNSQFFHDFVKEQLQISLNRKRPSIVDTINIAYLKIHQKDPNLVENVIVHQSEIFRCFIDFTLNFKGKIAVHITTKLKVPKQIPIDIKLLIKQFKCPIRVQFIPFTLAKSYASLLERPYLNIELCVKIADWNITRIPLVTRFIRTFILLKLRKKMLWPKRMTLSIPLAYRNTLLLAINERKQFEKQKTKRKTN